MNAKGPVIDRALPFKNSLDVDNPFITSPASGRISASTKVGWWRTVWRARSLWHINRLCAGGIKREHLNPALPSPISLSMTDTTVNRFDSPDWSVLFRRARDIVLGVLVAGAMALALVWSPGWLPDEDPSCDKKADTATVQLTRAATDHVATFCMDSITAEEREVVAPNGGGSGTVEFSLKPR